MLLFYKFILSTHFDKLTKNSVGDRTCDHSENKPDDCKQRKDVIRVSQWANMHNGLTNLGLKGEGSTLSRVFNNENPRLVPVNRHDESSCIQNKCHDDLISFNHKNYKEDDSDNSKKEQNQEIQLRAPLTGIFDLLEDIKFVIKFKTNFMVKECEYLKINIEQICPDPWFKKHHQEINNSISNLESTLSEIIKIISNNEEIKIKPIEKIGSLTSCLSDVKNGIRVFETAIKNLYESLAILKSNISALDLSSKVLFETVFPGAPLRETSLA